MYQVPQITDSVYYVGVNDRMKERFENVWSIPSGVAYNAYLIVDEKTTLIDTVDVCYSDVFFHKLDLILQGRPVDYLIINHMEPDHCAIIPDLVERFPKLKLVASAQGFKIMGQFYGFDIEPHKLQVKEGDVLELGQHSLSFVAAPMVHWPEVIMTFDKLTGTLFSADAFGAFGALGGNLFADEVEWRCDYAAEARRYYANIVGKYGPQTLAVLKKMGSLDIQMICPLHGHLWRKDFDEIVDRYQKWASYTPELDSVCVYYGSVYGNTANAAEILAAKLAERGVRDVRVYDSSKTDTSELVSRAFQYSTLVFAASTYNLEVFDSMDYLVQELSRHNLRNRTAAIMENGSWSPQAGSILQKRLGLMPNMTILEPMVKIRSAVREENLGQIEELADALAKSLGK